MLRRDRKAFPHHRTAASQSGFSLIECCIALLILLIASIGVATAFAFSIHNNSSAGDRAISVALAQQQMEQLRNLDFNDAGLAVTANPVVQNVTSAGRPFRVTTTITAVAVNAVAGSAKTIRIDVTPIGNSETWANGTVTLVTTRTIFTPGPNYCATC